MRLVTASMRHQGRYRDHNEDHVLAADDVRLYAVADGVEGEPFGEIASQLAIETLHQTIKSINLDEDATPPFDYAQGIPLPARALKFAFREANRRIIEKGGKEEKFKGMATTLCAAWFIENKLFVANVGDSRAYLTRKGKILQLSKDHTTLAQGNSDEKLDSAFMEDYSPSLEHELSRAMGINDDVEVQLTGGAIEAGDVLILCTDGLYGDLREWEIMEKVKETTPKLAAKALVDLAIKKGGMDNVAVVIVQAA